MASERREEFLTRNRERNRRNLTPEKVQQYNANRKNDPVAKHRDREKNRRYANQFPERQASYAENARAARKRKLNAMTPNAREDFLEQERAGRRMRRLIRRARELGAAVVQQITKRAVVDQYGSHCYLCGNNLAYRDITIDHVVALAKGGNHDLENTRPACRSCNLSKGAKPLEKHIQDQTLRLFRLPEIHY